MVNLKNDWPGSQSIIQKIQNICIHNSEAYFLFTLQLEYFGDVRMFVVDKLFQSFIHSICKEREVSNKEARVYRNYLLTYLATE